MISETASIRPVLFLDTNCLHYARLYFDFAKKNNLEPVGKRRADPAKQIQKLAKSQQTADSLESGRKIITHLQSECRNGAEAQFAPLSTVEMLFCALRGQGIALMAKELPVRFLTRIDETEIVRRLTNTHYRKASRISSRIINELASLGINISESNKGMSDQVHAISLCILKHLYMDVFDCMIYAHSLVSQASLFITSDSYLRRVASALQNLGAIPQVFPKHQFVLARKAIIHKFARVTGFPEADIKLPRVVKANKL